MLPHLSDIEIFELKMQSLDRKLCCLIWLVQNLKYKNNQAYINIADTLRLVQLQLSTIKTIKSEKIQLSELIFLNKIFNIQYKIFTNLAVGCN